jgi:hypothetical protein
MNVKRQLIKKEDGTRFLGDEIHLRQGDMDGACGLYCLTMAIIGLGLVDRDVIVSGEYHGNSKIATLIKELESLRGKYLFRNGVNRKYLRDAINVAFSRDVELLYPQDKDLSGKDFRSFINIFVKEDADKVWPVILEINTGKNTEWNHYVLVIGFEFNQEGESCYLLLDPGEEKPRLNECWNARLDEKGSGGTLPYWVKPNQGQPYRVAIKDALGFIPK